MKLLTVTLLMVGACTAPSVPVLSSPEDSQRVSDNKDLNSEEMLLSPTNFGNLDLYPIPSQAGGDKLIGGSPADRKNWPASFTTSQGNSRCTGTVIGEKTLQIAAHCVGNGRKATLTSKGKVYSSTCTHAPGYANDATADWALCLLDEAIPLEWYESIIEVDAPKPAMSDKILLAGMGCIQPGGGGGSNDVFRIGEAPIIRLPISNNDIVTKGAAALCFGDSGGSAFWKNDAGIYKVVGVNSRGNIRDTSYLSSTYTREAQTFYKSWAEKNSTSICGIQPSAMNCRGSDAPPPPPSPVPAWCKATYEQMGKCVFGNPRESLTNAQGCQDEYAKFYACQTASELEN